MATIPKDYKPPPIPPAIETNFPIDLTDTDILKVRQVEYRKWVVDFAIMQLTMEAGEWVHVARIDCCHGMIHRHQFAQNGRDLDGRLEIKAIPADDDNRWEIVQDGFYKAIGTMQEEWEDNLRRWRDGR
ncbi:DUF7718 family protein [Streptacidiphilus cavernicola]|uniref:DUF7718 domain-containing protein n=1 Tax=Streptacidiphilus cavernicola TaxID=3342716 RepID=A0ABV6VXY3_9ACTN